MPMKMHAFRCVCIFIQILAIYILPGGFICTRATIAFSRSTIPTDTWRNNNALITPKLRRGRGFDVIMTLFLRRVPLGYSDNPANHWMNESRGTSEHLFIKSNHCFRCWWHGMAMQTWCPGAMASATIARINNFPIMLSRLSVTVTAS